MTDEKDGLLTLPHTIKLKRPIKIGSIERTEIVFKNDLQASDLYNLSVAEQIELQNVPVQKFEAAICRMTEEPPAVIKALPPMTMIECVDVVYNFFVNGPSTGRG